MYPPSPQRPELSPASGRGFAGLNVLVVDDMPAIRRMLVLMLRRLGVGGVIQEAGDGQEALDMLQDQLFDLVVCDINMPHLSGLEVLKQLRASPRHQAIPVLLITGEVSEDTVARLAQKGANGYLLKPFQVKSLEIHLRRIFHDPPPTSKG